VNGEDSLFDVPPAAFGRFNVLQQLGAGTTGPIFRGEDPQTRTPVVIKVLRMNLPPKLAEEVAKGLAQLVDQLPAHVALAVPLASGLDARGPYLVSRFTAGDSLDVALRDYGPAAIEDLVPRIRLLAEALDSAAHAGFVHGSLHPRDIVVSAESTRLSGVGVAPLLARAGVAIPRRRPYVAPEILGGSDPSASADQFALAALAFEWMFGRKISGPAEARVDVPALPGVDSDALSGAFTTALAPDPGARFASSEAFADAVSASVIRSSAAVVSTTPDPELGLLSPQDDVPSEWFYPETAGASKVESLMNAESEAVPAFSQEAVPAFSPETVPAFSPEPLAEPLLAPAPVAWEPAALRPTKPERFGGGVLILTLMIGLAFGFAAGYMARPRALQHPMLAQPVPQGEVATTPSPATSGESPRTEPVAPVEKRETPAPPASPAAPPAPATPVPQPGRLLVRSTPTGASVSVDGVARGVTPLALRDLELGARTVIVAQNGFIADEQRVVLTKARPSRSLEVRLAAAPGGGKPSPPARGVAAPRPGAVKPPATPAAPAATSGSLFVDSRPAGAEVAIDGKPSGVTPLMIGAIPPGDYVVTIILKGYRPFSTTVRVVAGERARAAASLSAVEQE
jgi:hypothetical protein